jgi:hypothetical protein
MNVQVQNHLKFISILLITLAGLSIPADLPGGAYLAIVLGILGAAGYGLAHYLADPTTVGTDISNVLKALTHAVQDLKTAPVIQQPIDKNQLAIDVLNIMSQLAIKASPTTTSMTATIPATDAPP